MPSIEQLRAERDTLIDRVTRLDGLISRQEALDREYESDFRNDEGLRAGGAIPPITAVATGSVGLKRGPNGSSPEDIISAAESAVLEAGRRMTRYELVEAVEARGLVVGGADKARNMGTILWRSQRFENNGAGYFPRGDSE